MLFHHRVREETTLLRKTETWEAEINGYDVIMSIADDRTAELVIWKSPRDGLRLGTLTCHPKSVADVERFAEDAPALFREIAQGLREAGKDDLRNDSDRHRDNWEAWIKGGGLGDPPCSH